MLKRKTQPGSTVPSSDASTRFVQLPHRDMPIRRSLRALGLLLVGVVACTPGAESKPPTGDTTPAIDAGPALDAYADHNGESPPSCAEFPNDACLIGLTFAECAGPKAPAAYCSVKGGCVWVSNGCPLPDRRVPLTTDCSCEGPDCSSELAATMMSFFIGWGAEPWDREREMNLAVTFPHADVGGDPAISCAGCGTDCEDPGHPCSSPAPQVAQWRLGTTVVSFGGPGWGGWGLFLEIDWQASPARARLCQVAYTDAPTCTVGAPDCALSGTVKLATEPGEGLDVHGEISATFADGLSVTAEF